MKGRVLFLATVDITIYAFLIPYMKLLNSLGYNVEIACADTGTTGKIEKEGFIVYSLPFSRNPLSIKNIKAFFVLLKLMKKQKYIMVHTHTPIASFLGRIAGKIAKIPKIVYTAHGFHFHEYGSKLKNFLYFKLEKFAGKFTDVLITINTDDYKTAKERNLIPNGRIVFIKGVGVDVGSINSDVFTNRKRVFLRELKLANIKKPILVSVGRLASEKHFDQVIEALNSVKKNGKSFRCFIIGDGPQKSYLNNIIQKLNMPDEIILIGYSNRVFDFLNISSVFVFTSSREGLPVSVMEAMAMEKPIIAYNIRGVRDLVEDGINGFLVTFGDIKTLSEKIIYLMEHPEVAKEMGKRGREKIEKEFSLRVILPQMEKLYKDVLFDI